MAFQMGVDGGLSPLTRGNHCRVCACSASAGPIPAHAGEPGHAIRAKIHDGAYPRSRGGTGLAEKPPARRWGLSPLTRGNPIAPGGIGCKQGPIPAHAGEPSRSFGGSCWNRAYPRSRGGTPVRLTLQICVPGLSPLTRGNPDKTGFSDPEIGPIPAHAGEPSRARTHLGLGRAYPRSRGGTYQSCGFYFGGRGLSPLTRGNR